MLVVHLQALASVRLDKIVEGGDEKNGVGQVARSQNWGEGPLQLVTGKKTKFASQFAYGDSRYGNGEVKKNYHLGNPNYGILSTTIWVLT